METDLAKNPVGQIKLYVSDESVKKRFEEMLGKRSGAFLNSIINVVRNSEALQNCNPASVMSAATVAATLNLPIDKALGYAAIVPYGNSAVFQIMYKGVTQLCIRSGQYATIHCSEIYADELKSHNPITGVVKFNDPNTFKMRYAEKKDVNVVGHYAYLKLVSGFEKSDYMTHDEVMAHARKYSKAYKRDLKKKKRDCPWSTDPIPMGNKTVLLRLLKKYGVMSIEMQNAVIQDNSFEAADEAATKKIESEAGSEPVDAEFETDKDPATAEKAKKEAAKLRRAEARARKKAAKEAEKKGLCEFVCPICNRKYNYGAKEGIGVPCECGKGIIQPIEQEQTEEQTDAALDAALDDDSTESLYTCTNCGLCFNIPKTSGTGPTKVTICPECLSKDIAATVDAKASK